MYSKAITFSQNNQYLLAVLYGKSAPDENSCSLHFLSLDPASGSILLKLIKNEYNYSYKYSISSFIMTNDGKLLLPSIDSNIEVLMH